MPGSCSPWSLRFRFIYLCCRFSLSRCSGDFRFARWRGLPACSNSRRSLFSPLLELGARLGKLLLPGHAGKRGRLFAAREELKQITTESEREGALTATERAMIHSVVDFRGSKVRDVMLPSAKVAALRSGASTQEALELSASTGLDRLPVLAPDGQPAGLVNVPDILLERDGNKPLGEYVRRIVTTTDDEPAYRVMQQLRAARLGLAAVVDRKNNFRGIVAIEDLIRRLVSAGNA